MRARNIKPSLFKNELFAVADPLHTVVFIGLWCVADRDGRLEDRPARIHFDVNPGRPFEGTCRALDWLSEQGFIVRYMADGQRFIQVVNFSKHQNPHQREVPSTIPSPPMPQPRQCLGTDKVMSGPADSGFRIPDSGFLIALPPEESCGADAPRSPPKTRASRIPENWTPSPDLVAYAERELPGVDVEKLAEAFRDFWIAAAGERARKLNWAATWRTWVRRSARDYPTKRQPAPLGQIPGKRAPPTDEQIAVAHREAAEANRRELASKLGVLVRAIP